MHPGRAKPRREEVTVPFSLRACTPTLVFHGGADALVPLRTSQLLSGSRPDLVRCVAVPGATHGRVWNLDPDRYEEITREFLESVASG